MGYEDGLRELAVNPGFCEGGAVVSAGGNAGGWRWGMVGMPLWVGIVLVPAVAVAQLNLTPDTEPGRSLGTQVEPWNAQTDLITGGVRPQNGQNLFHSFQEFNVREGRTVYFDAPPGVLNVLSRVTGRDPSDILGRLGTARRDGSGLFASEANLFLINPNGVVFGPNARLDVDRSFVATTANAIGFGDRGSFSATNPSAPSELLTINPSVFLFDQINIAPIQSSSTNLSVGDRQSLLLLGGDVILDNSFLGVANVLGGRAELGGLAAPGKVDLAVERGLFHLGFPHDVLRGDVTLKNGSKIDVSAADGGSLAIHARNLTILDGSSLVAGIGSGLGTVNSQAGDITIDATDAVNVSGQSSNGQISAMNNWVNSGATGNGGSINIVAKSLMVADGAQISALTFGNGNSGNLVIQATDSVTLSGNSGGLFASVQAKGNGNSGNLNIGTNRLDISDGSVIFTGMLGEGNAGDLFINANNISLSNGGYISASTLGKGNAGNVTIQVNGDISLSGAGAVIVSNVQDKTAVGNAGNITITANSLSAQGGAQINSFTRGQGNAGNVTIQTNSTDADSITIDGEASGIFSIVEQGAIGIGGNIAITTNALTLTNGGSISSNTGGQGRAGNINIDVLGRFLLDGEGVGENSSSRSGVTTGIDPTGIGDGGNLTVIAQSISSTRGARLSANTNGKGNAGNISITVHDQFLIDGTSRNGSFGGAYSVVNVSGEGKGGNVDVRAGSLLMGNGARISASTLGKGNAGNVDITIVRTVF